MNVNHNTPITESSETDIARELINKLTCEQKKLAIKELRKRLGIVRVLQKT